MGSLVVPAVGLISVKSWAQSIGSAGLKKRLPERSLSLWVGTRAAETPAACTSSGEAAVGERGRAGREFNREQVAVPADSDGSGWIEVGSEAGGRPAGPGREGGACETPPTGLVGRASLGCRRSEGGCCAEKSGD